MDQEQVLLLGDLFIMDNMHAHMYHMSSGRSWTYMHHFLVMYVLKI